MKFSAAATAVRGTPQSAPPVVTPPIWMVVGTFAGRGVPVSRVSSARQGVASGMYSGPLRGCAAAAVARLSVRASTTSSTPVRIAPMEASLALRRVSARALADAVGGASGDSLACESPTSHTPPRGPPTPRCGGGDYPAQPEEANTPSCHSRSPRAYRAYTQACHCQTLPWLWVHDPMRPKPNKSTTMGNEPCGAPLGARRVRDCSCESPK